MNYKFKDWIKEEEEAIKKKCLCSQEVKKLRKKKKRDDVDLEVCPCGNHTLIMGHCIVCGAKMSKNTFGF